MSKVFRQIDTLKFDPANARKHDERNIKAIMDSLRMHGQRKPVVLYSDMIVAGNGTVAAAKRLGWTEVWVNNDPFESLEAAKAYALQDNRSAELAAWDDVVLGDTLEELKEAGWDLDDLGFSDSFVKSEVDYGLISDENLGGLIDDLKSGSRKAVQIEFELNHYDEAMELIKFWRLKNAYIGAMLVEKLKSEKLKIENI